MGWCAPSGPTTGFLRGTGAESITFLQPRTEETGRAEPRVPPHGPKGLGESLAPQTFCSAQCQGPIPRVPGLAGSVTFVWAGGHICAIKGASTGEDVNVFPQPERWFEFSQSSPSKQAEACQWKAGGCWEITTKREPLSVPARPEGGTAFEATDRLNRTFHLRDAGDGRSGCLQPPQNLIKASCRREEAHSCSPTPPHHPHGAAQGFLKTTGPPSQGPVGKPSTDALCSQTSERCGLGKVNPSAVLKRRGREAKHTEYAKTTHLMSAHLSETNSCQLPRRISKRTNRLNTPPQSSVHRGNCGKPGLL